MAEQRSRRAVFDNQPVIGEVDVIRDLARERHLVGDEDRRHPLLDELPDRQQHFLARFRIERATVWNVVDAGGVYRGQAATFSEWTPV